ncbi:1,4-dihydroxy-2-naphthoate octaprenyltransferase [Criblamydia sequanensis]|uniref:1,4-dihydroxy-2-naphthoate octaprenyltransferase n=1 Tax=Candidatus Criblamydia sequanensis CRIB-18 TaxID=1437425 RepID=A0A090D196_9BACT|nr:1,4-dihydroxy-2-naphthoate octaprenyltransferase [Criblamydia sequanensis]CDR33680.1 1,4-dihydroxy-2-naphthoateoctaprenyltransferase [Criblamydia sequanensis CRIB-18]
MKEALSFNLTEIIPWIYVLRPKTLLASFPPIFIAGSYSFFKRGEFEYLTIGLSLTVLLLFHLAVNVINDAIDFKKGGDTSLRLGPLRMTASGLLDSKVVLQAGILLIALAIIFSFPLILKGGWVVGFSVFIAALATYAYTGGPYPLAYIGLGELFVLLFFGFLATMLPFFIIEKTINLDIFLASFQTGLLSVSIIMVNNLRDIEEDSLTGKKTLAVRLGKNLYRSLLGVCLFLPFLLNSYWLSKPLMLGPIFSFIAFPMACFILMGVYTNKPSQIYNKYLALAALSNFLFGFGLSIGFILEK